jgi:cyclophilin family peptidyl-prolyl cis-trans isomerase
MSERRARRGAWPAALALAAAALLLAGCGGGDDEEDSAAGTTTAESTTTAGGTETVDATACRTVEQPPPRQDGGETAPKQELDPDTTYTVTVKTSCGDFTITLDQEASPKAAASFAALAANGFYDDTVFHRIVPGFVIQAGDPTVSGGGGPGYSTVDTPAADTTYPKGTVAMAKGSAEAPGTAGSQFFVVTAPDAGLPPDYAVVGKVTAGEDVVDLIGTLGDASEQPTQVVAISDMVVEPAP